MWLHMICIHLGKGSRPVQEKCRYTLLTFRYVKRYILCGNNVVVKFSIADFVCFIF